MKIELKPRLEKLVQAQLDAGVYADASEVVEDALALLEEHQSKISKLRAALSRARQDIADGRFAEIKDRDQLLALFEEP